MIRLWVPEGENPSTVMQAIKLGFACRPLHMGGEERPGMLFSSEQLAKEIIFGSHGPTLDGVE
jgi:hypothetical protein